MSGVSRSMNRTSRPSARNPSRYCVFLRDEVAWRVRVPKEARQEKAVVTIDRRCLDRNLTIKFVDPLDAPRSRWRRWTRRDDETDGLHQMGCVGSAPEQFEVRKSAAHQLRQSVLVAQICGAARVVVFPVAREEIVVGIPWPDRTTVGGLERTLHIKKPINPTRHSVRSEIVVSRDCLNVEIHSLDCRQKFLSRAGMKLGEELVVPRCPEDVDRTDIEFRAASASGVELPA